MPDLTPVDGPHRIHVRRIPAGVEMDVSHFVTHLLVQLARDFEEDPEGLAAELTEIAELDRSARHQGSDSHATHERDAKVDGLLATLGGGSQLIYGKQVRLLAAALLSAGQIALVPTQQDRRAS